MRVTSGGPLAGVRVVEVAVGVSDLGLGLAGGVPGRVLADLGAAVTRVVGTAPVARRRRANGHVWHKQVVATTRRRDPGPARRRRRRSVYGPEALSRDGALRRRGALTIPRGYVALRAEPHRRRRGRGLRPAGRGAGRVLHPARRPPPRSDLRGRPGLGRGDLLPGAGLRAGAARPPGRDRRRRLGRDLALRRDAGHPRLHDRALRARARARRGVLAGGLDLPQLPLPLRRRGAHPGVVRWQGHVRQAPRGAGRRAQRRGLLRRSDRRPPRRPGAAVAVVLRHPAPRRLDRAPARRRRGLRAGVRFGERCRLIWAPSPGRAGRSMATRSSRRSCRATLALRGRR